MMNPPDLPIGWCAFTDEKSQRTYYAHIPTGNVRWDPPPSNPPPPPPPMPPTHPAPPPPPPRMIQQAPLQTDSSHNGCVTPSPLTQNEFHPSEHHHAHNSSFQLPTPPISSMFSHFEPRGLKRPHDYHEQNFVKRKYGLTSNNQNQVKQTRTDQHKRCSQCKIEQGRDKFSKTQWCKKDSERKCKHCVEIRLGVERQSANIAQKKLKTVGTITEGSPSLENVNSTSSLTDEPPPPRITEPSNNRLKICCLCRKERDWIEFSKTQWMSPSLLRKCKVCIDEKKQKIRQGKEKPATKEGDADIIQPEIVSSLHIASKHADTAEFHGILKNNPATAPLNSKVIKEENTKASLISSDKQANHNPALSGLGHNDKTQDLFLSEKLKTRLCSCCNNECPWGQYTKTQWLLSTKFRKCKSCIEKDPNTSESIAKLSGKKTRRAYEESGDELRKCAK